MRKLLFVLAIGLFFASRVYAQSEVVHRDDFQSYKTPSNVPGWVDTSVGSAKPEAGGLYKAWDDPLQPSNVVYGTKQSSGKPEGNNPRIGTFSTLTTKKFDAKGRFEYSGRLLRTRDDSRIGLTFLSSYPEADQYYLIGLWSHAADARLTMQLFGFGAGTPAGTVDSNLSIDPNRWYRFFIQVDADGGATKIRARFWPDGASEPSTFSIDATDSGPAHLTAGRIGMWGAVKGDAYVDDLFAHSPVDHDPPVVTLRIDGAPFAAGAIFSKDVTLSAAVQDLSTVTTVATLDGATVTLPKPIAEERLHSISVTATDQVGLRSTASSSFLVDKSAPELTILANGITLGGGQSFQKDVTLTWSATDLTLDRIEATLDGAPIASGTTVTAEGIHTLVVSAYDKAGHVVTATRGFILSKTAPRVRLIANGDTFTPGTLFKAPVAFTIETTAITATTSVATVDDQPYTLGTALSAEGAHSIKVVVTDAVGLSTTVGPSSFTLDLTPPSVTLTESGEPLRDGMKFNRDVRPVVAATDNLTAAPARALTLDGHDFPLDTAISEESADHVLSAKATDDAGNSRSIGPFHFVLDKTKPVVAIVDEATGKPLGEGALFAHPVRVKIVVTDLTATMIAATLDGAPFDPANSITADGTHTVSAVATDAVGWQSDPVTAMFTIDQVAPHLTFTSPAEGAVVGTPAVVVAGGADDAVSVVIGGAAATIDPVAKTFASDPIALIEGRNTIAARATDSAGNTVTAELHLELDTRAPALSVDTPAAGACIDATAITVAGTVSDPRIESVKVNGIAATLDRGSWTASVPADEGAQLLTIVAADTVGHLTTVTRSVLVDRTAPVIEVRESGAPLTGTLFNRTITLSLRAVDADPSTQLTATLDSAPYASGASIDAVGAHTVVVTAVDCAGHRKSETFAFTIDRTPPSIRNLNPANGSTVGSTPAGIAGTADADTATVEILGTGISAAPTPDFALSGVSFAEGLNQFVLRATDRAGNAAQVDYSVTVRTAAPVVTIVESGSPLPPSAIFNRAIRPEIQVSDPNATVTATLDGAPYTSGAEIAADGDHRLKATATDSLQHSATAEAAFTIDRVPPTVHIDFPKPGSVSAEQVEVRGTAPNAVSADVNGQEVALDANGAFVLPTLHLEFGTTRIVATARDRAGNAGTDQVEVTRDDVRPGILLTYPPDRAVTNRPTTEVLGRILSPNPDRVVTIGSQTTPVDPLGAFRLSGYPLVEGDNTITASTKTNNGAVNSASVVVTADFTPPALTILESAQPLNDGARFASQAVLSLQTSDNRGTPTVELTVDGVKAASMPASVAANGGHVAVAVARDAAGNETRVERTFFIGAAGGGAATCALDSFDPPAGAVVLSSSATLLGRTTSAGVKANDVVASVADGSFRATVELPREGANAVTLRCTDGAGAAFGDAVTLTLSRVTGDPSIEITSPAEGLVTANETITVSGTVGPGVVTADVNGAAAVIAGSDPSAARPFTVAGVRLAGGLNILAARGSNAAGRVATASRRVIALRNQPSLVVTSPVTGATTGASKIEVAGTFANLDPATITVANLASGATAAIQTTRRSDTTGTFVASEVPLVAGEQTLRVSGRDQANRSTTVSVVVRLTTGTPSISITAPASNAYFGPGASTFTVSGAFAAAAGSTVDVGGVAATISGSTFSAAAPFAAIGNSTTVVARVTEPGGASAVDTVTVIRLGAAPTVTESFPAPNAVEVDAGAALLVLFSAPMDRTSLANGAFRLEDAGGAAVGGTLYLDNDVLTFAPAALLARGGHYTLRVTTAAKDLAGTPLQSEYAAPFTVGASAPSTPPSVEPVSQAFCGQTVTIKGTAPAGARLQLASGTLALTTVADASGAFRFDFPLSGQSGFAVVRVRVVGSDGSLSPAAELSFRVDCVGPQVLNANYDRGGANKLAIDFSEPVVVPDGAITIALSDGSTLTGTATATGNSVAFVPAQDLTARSFTLNVTTAVRDAIGNHLAAAYTQTFTIGGEQPVAGNGSGFISGEVYDATTGRPLEGAGIAVEVSAASFTTTTDPRGRYLVRLPEGAHTIRASMTGYTSVWRQIVIPAGAGVVPIDIRLTKRNDTSTHGGETAITRTVSVTGGAKVTAVGAQALTGLLPLGWSPLACAEVAGDLTAATLTFTVPASDIVAASQSLAAVRYDETRDEWDVLASVVNVVDGKVAVPITGPGTYALVYPDKAPGLAVPPLAQSGAVLAGVAAPAASAPLVSRAFTLDPPVVLPNGRTVAALRIEGAGANFPSGTAVQAYIDEELHLADGSRLSDPPFATDLLLYRSLDGTLGTADFHLAPSPRAAKVILEIGFDHIRVVPYPGRLDRGTLVGSEGGPIPGDDRIAVDIPAGAAPEPLRAAAVSLTQQDLDAVGPIQGFAIAGGFTLTLQRATPAQPPDLDHDGTPDGPTPPVQLFKPARATFTLGAQYAGKQLILVELLDQSPYGRMVRLANLIERPSDLRAATKTIDRSVLPLDGIVHEGRYLLLAANAPIAFATGVLRLGNALLADARITAGTLGVAELTRRDGLYNIPVPAAPAAPFTLTPRYTNIGDGAAYTHASSPAADAVVRVDLTLHPQPPSLVSVTVFAGNPLAQVSLGGNVTDVSLSTSVRATFSPAIDPSSVNDASIAVLDADTGVAVGGKSVADGNLAVNWALTPGTTLQANHRYAAAVSPYIRGVSGAQLGAVSSYGFTTAAVILNAEVHAERISITIPDANGVSRVTGGAGALPANWQAVAVRRGRDFVTRYQATAAGDGSFTFLLGNGGDAGDRVTMADLIDLRVVNNAGNLAAIIPLTPFVTEDRRGFVVPAGAGARFVTADNITVDVAEGTFDDATLVTANVAQKQLFDEIPSLDHDVNFAASVQLDFEGLAKKPIELEIPVPAGMDTTNRNFILAVKGQSVRGPRLMAVDTLRVADGKFTTARSATAGKRTRMLSNDDIKNDLLRVDRAGAYAVTEIRTPAGGSVGWAAISGLQRLNDLFYSALESFYAAHYYIFDRNRILIPVPNGIAFTVVGVDATTGLQSFSKAYDPIPAGDGVAVLAPPEDNFGGPYPIYGTPFRVDQVDLSAAGVDIRSARNFILRLTNNQLSLAPSPDEPLPAATRVQMLDVNNGKSIAGTSGGGLTLTANRGDRIVLLVEQYEVDPNTPISVVFNEPIHLAGTTPEDIDSYLRTLLKLLKAPLPPPAAPGTPAPAPVFTDVTPMAHFSADSGGRRVTITLPSSFQRDALYRLVLSKDITDVASQNGGPYLTLGQGTELQGNNLVPAGGRIDLLLDFRVRKPGGTLGSFQLPAGATRDMALNGNVLFVAGSQGGLYAYDVADPASLQGTPTPLAVAPTMGNDFWAVATDHHGRVYTTSLGPINGWLRSYRLENFVGGGTCCTVYANSLINWHPGYASSIGLLDSTFLSDRPEGFPRKIQLAVQDTELAYATRQEFLDNTRGAAIVTSYANGMATMQATFTADPKNPYVVQRITVENQTLDMRWSADATPSHPAVIANILAAPGDRVRVLRNRTTYGFVSLIGYGIGMYDLNAMESNRSLDRTLGISSMAEQIEVTHGKIDPACVQPNTEVIPDISVSADSAIRFDPQKQFELYAYAPDPYRGLLDLRFLLPESPTPAPPPLNPTCADKRGPVGLLLRGVNPANDHPRIKALKSLYALAANGGQPYPTFFSVANYSWRLEAQNNKSGERQSARGSTVQRDYVLLAGGDFGLLVVEVGGNPPLPLGNFAYYPLVNDDLADIIWIPDGALAVRTIPRTNFAVVVSRYGRVHLVDLSRIDERFDSNGNMRPANALFPTAAAAIQGKRQFPEGVGAPDPRIVWSSDPGIVTGALPPVIDPDTGMLYAGQMTEKILKAIAAIDPRVEMKVDLGQSTLSEVSGVVPLGVDPPQKIQADINNLPPCNGATVHCKENASLGAFRLEVSLPGAIVQLLKASNQELQVAVESEVVAGAVTEQTPAGFPRAHLRRARRDGSPEDPARIASNFRLQRLVPNDPPLEKALRYQKGFNKYVSPWIVAIADPRASTKYLWPAGTTAQQKADAGCRSCNRPKWLENFSEPEVFELFTNGRIINVRPEVVSGGKNIFDGTPYAYLGSENRLAARFSTIMADTVRATDVRVAGQNPPVADGAVQDTVYVHSGEMQTATVDLESGGRNGFDVLFDRTYRSWTMGGTALGQGWESSNFRRLRALPDGNIELRDSSGEIWLFTLDAKAGEYVSPKGFFLHLVRTEFGWILLDQKWRVTAFDDLGRLSYENDEFSAAAAVNAGTNVGNAVRYLYDASGRLARIVDPVDRASELYYWNESDAGTPGAYPGLLREIRDWRKRSTLYEYDPLGRLVTVKGPEVAAADGVPADYSFIGANRPRTEYGYQSVQPPAPTVVTPSQAFDDYLDFIGNLTSIKEPDQVAKGAAGKPRVTLAYGASGYPRDRLETQAWATGENVTFTHVSPTEVMNEDAYGQRRYYKLTAAGTHDGRVHVAEGRIEAVAIISTGTITGPADVGLQHSAADLEATFTYNDEGLHTSVEYSNGQKVTNTWKYANEPSTPNREKSLAPGMLLEHSVTDGPGLLAPIHSDLKFDKSHPTAAGTQVSLGRGTATDIKYRDAQSPSRDRKLVSQQDEGFEFHTDYNNFGLPTEVRKLQNGVTKQRTDTDYYSPTDPTPAVARSRPSKLTSGMSTIEMSQSFAYAETPTGGEKITINDDKRGTVTETEFDAHGRKIRILITGANQVVLQKESFGYDAAGRAAYRSRQQTGVGLVETRTTYDAMGRVISTTTTGASVNGSPTSLTTTTQYDDPGRTVTEVGPFAGTPAGAPKTVTTVDGLGRPKFIEHQGANGEIVRSVIGHDRSGEVSYHSDGVRSATLTIHDAKGRSIDSVTAEGVRTKTLWDAWDQPLEVTVLDANGDTIGQTKNFFSDLGRLRATNFGVDFGGRARTTYMTWNDADTDRGTRIGPVPTLYTAAPAGPVRVTEQYFDALGRMTRGIFGATTGPSDVPSGPDLLDETTYTYGNGGNAPTKVTASEPRAGVSSSATTVFDGLDRSIETTIEGATDSTKKTYDEAGNVVVLKSQGMDPSSATYDARGLVTSRTHPGGGTISYAYDALGSLREYKDENGVATKYTTDGLGRVTKVEYPDGTSEETTFEANTGMVLATRDRAGQWLAYEYGPSGRLLAVHIGQDITKPKLTEYEYDAGARLKTIRNKDGAIEYEGYDLLGRPTITRTVRYANRSGFDNPPVVLDVHTQTHAWSVFDGERDSWRMPAAGRTVGPDDPASPWLQTIAETRDAGSNLIQQQAGVVDLLTAEGRSTRKLKSRKRAAGGSLFLETEYAYAGDSGGGTKSFLIAKAASKIGATTVGGSENARDAADRLQSTLDLGMGNRVSTWLYDARGRLERSWLNVVAAGPRSPTADTVTSADFREKRDIPPILSPTQHQSLGASAAAIEPLNWTATKNNANQLAKRDSTLDGQVQDSRVYAFTGGRRTQDGNWESQFDEIGRLVAMTNSRAGRRIEYRWGPTNRIIGRAALKASLAGGWETENRFSILQADGIPARTTFVWDPIVDRLVAIFEEGESINPSGTPVAPEAGLVREYLHGDQGADDPIRVLTADDNGTVHAYLPLIDEAGAGSLQSVIDAKSGNVVERVLYADAYGDAPRYLQGPVVDSIDVEAKKDKDNKLENVVVRMHLTEAIDAASLSGGVRLGAINASKLMVRPTTATPKLEDDYTIAWTIDAFEWQSMSGAGEALEAAVLSSLRFSRWGSTPASDAPSWAVQVYGVVAEPGAPVIARQSFASLASFIDAIPAKESKETNVYGMTDLYLAASPVSRTKLLTGFKAAPFIEPATSLVYLRARWYDPATGTFLTPDPAGYKDSSNLYAGFDHDPVNNDDPTGQYVESAWDAVSLAWGIYDITQWDENTTTLQMTMDLVGVTYDAFALAVPFLPGGAGTLLHAAREYKAIGTVGRMIKRARDVYQGGTAILHGAHAAGRMKTRWVNGQLHLDRETALDTLEVGLGLYAAYHLLAPKRTPHAEEAPGSAPCPVPLRPRCLAAGARIDTPDGGAKPIENLRVGDRVAATHLTDAPEGLTTFDPRQWHLVRLRATNPDDPHDSYDVETLRPLAWIVEHEAWPGRTITFESERGLHDHATVIALERMPEIASGPGRVVLSTFTHHDRLLRLRFEGRSEPLHATPSHRLFSVEKNTWIPASELKPGDHVRTREGKATIASIEHEEVALVFDIEVELDHSYFVDGADVLSHNCPVVTARINTAGEVEESWSRSEIATRFPNAVDYSHIVRDILLKMNNANALISSGFRAFTTVGSAKVSTASMEWIEEFWLRNSMSGRPGSLVRPALNIIRPRNFPQDVDEYLTRLHGGLTVEQGAMHFSNQGPLSSFVNQSHGGEMGRLARGHSPNSVPITRFIVRFVP